MFGRHRYGHDPGRELLASTTTLLRELLRVGRVRGSLLGAKRNRRPELLGELTVAMLDVGLWPARDLYWLFTYSLLRARALWEST